MNNTVTPGDIAGEKNLHDTLSEHSDAMFQTLFGLSADVTDLQHGLKPEFSAAGLIPPVAERFRAAMQKCVQDDPLTPKNVLESTEEGKRLFAEQAEAKRNAFRQLCMMSSGSDIVRGMMAGRMNGFRSLALLHYMKQHPDVAFQDVMDPKKDPAGKRQAADEVIAAAQRMVGVRTETRDGRTCHIIGAGNPDAMIPIVTDAIRTLSSINVRDTVLGCLGVDPQTSPEQVAQIFGDPQLQSTIRPIMAAISDLYQDAGAAMSAFGLAGVPPKRRMQHRVVDGVNGALTPEEQAQWKQTLANMPYLQHDSMLYELSVAGDGMTGDPEAVAQAMLVSAAAHERIAAKGTLAAVDGDPEVTDVRTRHLDHAAMIFDTVGKTAGDIIQGQECRDYLDHGLPQDKRAEFSEVFRFTEAAAPAPRTAQIRRDLDEIRTPMQLENFVEAVSKLAPDVMNEKAVRDMISQARLTSNCMNVRFVDPTFTPDDTMKGDPREHRFREVSVIKPETLAELKSRIADYLDYIDESKDAKFDGIGDRYRMEWNRLAAMPERTDALKAGVSVRTALDGITQDRVQVMEDLYARMKKDHSFWHRDSDQYKAMFQAVTAVHERAAKGYDPQDPIAQAEMAGLFADACRKAQVYADKEVEGRTKRSQRGLDRKNYALLILTNTGLHKPGESTWYLPDGYDHRRTTAERAEALDTRGLDGLLKEEARENRTHREHRTGRAPFSGGAPAAAPAQTDSADRHPTARVIREHINEVGEEYRRVIEDGLTPAELQDLQTGGPRAKALQDATGVKMGFSRTSGQSAFYAWLMAEKDYTLEQVMELRDSKDDTRSRLFHEFEEDMLKNYPKGPEGAKKFGVLHRKAMEKIQQFTYPDEDVKTAADVMKVTEKARFASNIVVDLVQDSDNLISRTTQHENRAAYMEGAGGELEYTRLVDRLTASAQMCREVMNVSGADEIVYAERLAMFREYWQNIRGKKLAEVEGPDPTEYKDRLTAHLISPKTYQPGQEAQQRADQETAAKYLRGEIDTLPWEQELKQRVQSGYQQSRQDINGMFDGLSRSIERRPLIPIREEIEAFREGDPLEPEKMRKAGALFERTMGSIYPPDVKSMLGAIGKDPYDLITIDGMSLRQVVDGSDKKDLPPLEKERTMQAAFLGALADPVRRVEFSTVRVREDGTPVVGEDKHRVQMAPREIPLTPGDATEMDLKQAADAFKTINPQVQRGTDAERVLASASRRLILDLSTREQDDALMRHKKNIYDCLFINGMSVNDLYSTRYPMAKQNDAKADSIKRAMLAAARMDENACVVYRPVDEKSKDFRLCEPVSIGIGENVPGVTPEMRQKISATATKAIRRALVAEKHPELARLRESEPMTTFVDIGGLQLDMSDLMQRRLAGQDISSYMNLSGKLDALSNSSGRTVEKLAHFEAVDGFNGRQYYTYTETGRLIDHLNRDQYRDFIDDFTDYVAGLQGDQTGVIADSLCKCLADKCDPAGKSVTDALSRTTKANVQTLDEVYQRLTEKGGKKTAREYTEMIEALREIHEAAATYDPDNVDDRMKMTALFSKAGEKAMRYANMEAVKSKWTDAGVERKNATLLILDTVCEIPSEMRIKDLNLIDAQGKRKKAVSLKNLIAEEKKTTHALYGKKAEKPRHEHKHDKGQKTTDATEVKPN
ncbi:MAG: hypothetical protein K6G16_09795 [Lachnospiraceae bacterium]|nr:hypothetical protein [Lachnospiraceae bacterium]